MNRGKKCKKHGINSNYIEIFELMMKVFYFNLKPEALHHPNLPSFFLHLFQAKISNTRQEEGFQAE